MPLIFRIIALRFLLILSVAVTAALPANADGPAPVFDFRQVDFQDRGDVTMKGDWLFRYGELLSPVEAYAAYESGNMDVVDVPSPWSQHVPEAKENRLLKGYGSYVVRMLLPEAGEDPLVLVAPRIKDAYEIYWIPMNAPDEAVRIAAEGTMTGKLVASQGHQAHGLARGSDGLLLINVRSEMTVRQGIVRALKVYESSHYQASLQMERLFEGALMGFMLLVAVLNLCLYIFHRKDHATLVLTLAGLAILIRSVCVGGSIETVFGPEWRPFRLRLEYANAFFLLWTAVLLNQTLLWERIRHWRMITIVGGLCAIGVAYSLIAPLPYVTMAARTIQWAGFAAILMILIGCCLAVYRKVPNAIPFLLGWLTMLTAAVYDVVTTLYTGHMVNTLDVMFAIGIMAYSVTVGRRVIQAINRAEFLEEERALLQKLHQDAVDTARHDHLTGLLNRQAFDDEMAHAWLQREKEDGQLSLVLFDIDHFKGINDTHGHPIGDKVLKSVAALLKETRLRKSDRICRYGGEEFALILPGTRGKDAVKIAERLRQSIAGHITECSPDLSLIITCSFGVASASAKGPSEPALLIEEADAALYQAKATGRNRVERYGMPPQADISAKTA
ncbi:diguanylate cyclase (GGDEF)-like protein [Shimia isoporae]|uniref:diguanylate cyclase n=1 Tax=Shimia isoporae TaxID=647720 RepID=A0A4R1NN49_9RHOB|nr:diguanylate cyclase [Shimia isoporae]TCL09219.1 diguanylate cyclase (GGDEF)-like protein [Shimia isoporae]